MRVLTKLMIILMLLSTLYSADTTRVTSNDATYDGNQIILSGHVTIENVMGIVHADQALLKRDLEGNSKIDFPWAELSQNVVAELSDGGVFHCQKMIFDYENLRSDFLGPGEIHYKGPQGEVFAHAATIDFRKKDQTIEPIKMTLWGGVRMIHKEPAEQYALADIVEYYPEEEVVLLKGKSQEHVLFFDESRGIQLAASQVKVKKNGESGKEQVQGIGDVSFLFKESELAKLKDRFQWERR